MRQRSTIWVALAGGRLRPPSASLQQSPSWQTSIMIVRDVELDAGGGVVGVVVAIDAGLLVKHSADIRCLSS